MMAVPCREFDISRTSCSSECPHSASNYRTPATARQQWLDERKSSKDSRVRWLQNPTAGQLFGQPQLKACLRCWTVVLAPRTPGAVPAMLAVVTSTGEFRGLMWNDWLAGRSTPSTVSLCRDHPVATKSSAQDQFLDALRRERTLVSIYLVNGIRLHGRVAGIDRHVVLLEDREVHIVYKHAISTIMPGSPAGQAGR